LQDMQRPLYMRPQDALQYNIIDEIIQPNRWEACASVMRFRAAHMLLLQWKLQTLGAQAYACAGSDPIAALLKEQALSINHPPVSHTG